MGHINPKRLALFSLVAVLLKTAGESADTLSVSASEGDGLSVSAERAGTRPREESPPRAEGGLGLDMSKLNRRVAEGAVYDVFPGKPRPPRAPSGQERVRTVERPMVVSVPSPVVVEVPVPVVVEGPVPVVVEVPAPVVVEVPAPVVVEGPVPVVVEVPAPVVVEAPVPVVMEAPVPVVAPTSSPAGLGPDGKARSGAGPTVASGRAAPSPPASAQAAKLDQAPVPPPPPPVVAQPPPFPYKYAGRQQQSSGRTVYFLTKSNKLYTVEVGQVLDKLYSIDGEEDGQLTVTYLPLERKQTISVGSPS